MCLLMGVRVARGTAIAFRPSTREDVSLLLEVRRLLVRPEIGPRMLLKAIVEEGECISGV